MLFLAREEMKSESDICRCLSRVLCSHLSRSEFGGQAGTRSGASMPQADKSWKGAERTPQLCSVRTGREKKNGGFALPVVLPTQVLTKWKSRQKLQVLVLHLKSYHKINERAKKRMASTNIWLVSFSSWDVKQSKTWSKDVLQTTLSELRPRKASCPEQI